MTSQSLLNRRHRHKKPPVRFVDLTSPLPPHHEEHHASQHKLPQEISENPQSEIDESGTDPEEFDEVITVSLSELRNNVQCPICLGIIKNTRTVMRCLHRFCKECIDKSMRLGNNECPVCRNHCPSRRSLRDDPNFDALISSVYADVDKYEEKELVIHEEKRSRNEQTSIAQIHKQQSKALIKVQKRSKDIASSTSRVPRHYRNKKQDESDADENSLIKRRGIPLVQAPLVVIDVEDAEGIQSASKPTNENIKSSPGLVNPNLFSWGGTSRVRSQKRHGGSDSI